MRTEVWVERKPENQEQVCEGDEGDQWDWEEEQLPSVSGRLLCFSLEDPNGCWISLKAFMKPPAYIAC